MASFSDYALALLHGGLPEALDTGRTSTAQGDTRPETTAPTGTAADKSAGTAKPSTITTALKQWAPVMILGGIAIVGVVLLLRRPRRG